MENLVLESRKAEGRAGHQATQFTGALMAELMVVLMVKVITTLLVMTIQDGDSAESSSLTCVLELKLRRRNVDVWTYGRGQFMVVMLIYNNFDSDDTRWW